MRDQNVSGPFSQMLWFELGIEHIVLHIKRTPYPDIAITSLTYKQILLPCIVDLIMASQKGKSDCYYHLQNIIKTGDIGAVKKHIQDNNLTHDNYNGFTPVEYMYGRAHDYPVIVAVQCGNVNILNYLLSIGFSLKPKFRCLTPLMLDACKRGHTAVVKVLVELHGVDVNIIYHPNETALSEAALAGHLEIFQYLLGKGASADVNKHGNRTPLHAAVTGQNVQIVKILSRYIDVDITVNSGCITPLTLAASLENGEILTALLDAGADIEGNNPTMSSPFCIAVSYGKLENAKILYSQGANPERRNSDQRTSLEIAIQKDNYEMLRYLVVELNLPWDDNKSPIVIALTYRRTSFIKLLIDAGFERTREESKRRNLFFKTDLVQSKNPRANLLFQNETFTGKKSVTRG